MAERTRHFRRCSGKVWIGTVSVEISVYPCVTVGLCVSVVMVGWGVVGVYGIKGIHLEKQGHQIYINYQSGQNLFWLLVKKLKNMVSTSTLLYNKENIIRSNILLKNENNQLKGKIAQRTSTLKAARIFFLGPFTPSVAEIWHADINIK